VGIKEVVMLRYRLKGIRYYVWSRYGVRIYVEYGRSSILWN